MKNNDKPIEEMDDEEWEAWLEKYIENLQAIKKLSVKDFFEGF